MKYLLDVNVLVGLGLADHEFHKAVSAWVHQMLLTGNTELATCSITELGFIRVVMQVPHSGLTAAQAGGLLQRLKGERAFKFSFLADDQDVSYLPAWVKTARQTTDGHLVQLARRKGATLATLDKAIPGAFLIPTA
jgi:predicted nucleic acid-binding protein